jgi:IrrE N-terminal-like domain
MYRHPGLAFLAETPEATRSTPAAVLDYADFLRRSAQLTDPPTDLEAIYRQFEMPTPIRAPLEDQQGILVDGDRGLILIKGDDPIVRQRFTESHELMELFFDAPTGLQLPGPEKERWCDRGAAQLLMPKDSFGPRVENLGVSLDTARILALTFETSLVATLMQMMACSSGSHALVVWHWAGAARSGEALRIWWRAHSRHWSGGFIPRNKSIGEGSVLGLAYRWQEFYSGTEVVKLGDRSVSCHIEAQPVQLGNKRCVLSLLHCLD